MKTCVLKTVLLILCECEVGFIVALIIYWACVQSGCQDSYLFYNTHVCRARSPVRGSTKPTVVFIHLTLPKGITSSLMLGPKLPHLYKWQCWGHCYEQKDIGQINRGLEVGFRGILGSLL